MKHAPTVPGYARHPIEAGPGDAYPAQLHAALAQMQDERDAAREALAVTRQQVEVALAIVPQLPDLVDQDADLLLVIADVVHKWRKLTPTGQAAYAYTGTGLSPLAMFAADYVDAVGEGSGDSPDEEYGDPGEADRAVRWHVQEHLDRLRSGQPVPLRRQLVLVGKGDHVVACPATEQQRRFFELPVEQAVVVQVWHPTGGVDIYGARGVIFRPCEQTSDETP